jgi:hypothetical protein
MIEIKASEMTLHDYFAAKALQGLLANPKLTHKILEIWTDEDRWIEETAYLYADAMIEAKDAT